MIPAMEAPAPGISVELLGAEWESSEIEINIKGPTPARKAVTSSTHPRAYRLQHNFRCLQEFVFHNGLFNIATEKLRFAIDDID